MSHLYRITTILPIGLLLLLIGACNRPVSIPKPKGFVRMEFPTPHYIASDSGYPFYIEYDATARWIAVSNRPYWFNIDYPHYQAQLYFSYYNLKDHQLETLTKESRLLLQRHEKTAESIQERYYENPSGRVYTTIYNIYGNVASALQITITDSTDHFLRGALYLQNENRSDSLTPLVQKIEADIWHLLETLKWK